MSGIVGLQNLDGRPADRHEIGRMVDRMAYRGPDGSAVWCEGPVGLGHLMLHTTRESLHETLPLALPNGLAITADARIDNRDELISLLGLKPSSRTPVTDSELILAAYEKWGVECPEKLIGDFAFAIWDGTAGTAQRLFCGRDHCGVKPLYYSFQESRHFAFSSEIKGLLSHPDVPELLNEVRFAEYLADQGRNDKEATVFQGIMRLPPGSTLSVSAKGIERRRYWKPTVRKPQVVLTDEEYAGQFREIFQEAVRCRLRSALPIGTTLSGGLDSSYVTCVARDVLPGTQPLHTISMTYDVMRGCDERSYIHAVLDRGGFEPHFVSGDDFGPLTFLDEIFDHLDDGFTAGNHHMVWACYRTAGEEGVRVVLDGVDGDTVVSHGLDYFSELARAGEWKLFAEEVRAAEALMRETPDKQTFHEVLGSPRDLIKQHGFTLLAEHADQGRPVRLLVTLVKMRRHLPVRFWRLLRIFGRRSLASLMGRRPVAKTVSPAAELTEDLVGRYNLEGRFAATSQPAPTSVREGQRSVLDSDVFARSLEVIDHYAAAHSLEIRHPFMDKRLIDFCLSLPAEQSYRRGWTRFVQRNAMSGVVPEAVRNRRGKISLAAAFDHGLFTIDASTLRAAVGGKSPLSQYLKPEVIREYYEGGAEQPGKRIWRLGLYATMSIWLRSRGLDRDNGDLERSWGAAGVGIDLADRDGQVPAVSAAP